MIFFLNINCFEIAYPIIKSIVFSFYGFDFKDDFFSSSRSQNTEIHQRERKLWERYIFLVGFMDIIYNNIYYLKISFI